MDLSSIAYPKLEDIQSALFIQPHPDDNEIGAGGTMAYLTHRGIPVYGLTVTEGRGGSKTIEPEELGKIRKIEAQNAMDVLGVVNLGCLGYHDNRPIIHETLVKSLSVSSVKSNHRQFSRLIHSCLMRCIRFTFRLVELFRKLICDADRSIIHLKIMRNMPMHSVRILSVFTSLQMIIRS